MTVDPAIPSAAAQQGPSSGTRRTCWQVQRDVLFALIVREAHARVGGQWVGAIWTLIEPLAHTLLLVILYGIVIGRDAPAGEYPVFLAVGLITFFFFQNLSSRLVDGIDSNRGVFAYRQVKPVDVLAARAVVEFGMNLLVFLFTMGLLGWLGFSVVPTDLLGLIGVQLLTAAFGAGYGLLLAVLTHERPRLRSLVRMTSMPLYIASGVMFPVDVLPRDYIDILLWNPLLHLVELARHAVIPAYRPADGIGAGYPLLVTLVMLVWGLALYRAKRHILIAS